MLETSICKSLYWEPQHAVVPRAVFQVRQAPAFVDHADTVSVGVLVRI